jgi:RNA polymerase sigma-70 factor (ECF subfamily)
VFVRVIKAAHTFRPQRASFRTWLFSVARNCCIDAIRSKQRARTVPVEGAGQDGDGERPALLDTLADPDQDVEGAAIRGAVIQAVRDCIAQLANEDERQAILLYYMAGKVYREIGAVLGKSTSMARNRVKSAQDKVRACLEQKGVL